MTRILLVLLIAAQNASAQKATALDPSFQAFLPRWEAAQSRFINGDAAERKRHTSQQSAVTIVGRFGGVGEYADPLMEKQGTTPPSPAEQFAGTWTGTWDGAGSGGFELTLENEPAGGLTGRVSVTGEPTYKATLTALSFDGNRMTGRYDFPPDDRAEVILTASFEGSTATGTWSLREKGTANEVANGGWNVTRK